MPKYKLDIKDNFRSDAEVILMYKAAKTDDERLWIALLWKTAARPSELLALVKEDIVISGDNIVIRLITEKLKQGDYHTPYRTLEFERPRGLDIDSLLEAIVFLTNKIEPQQKIFVNGLRWGQKAINRIGIEVFGKPYSPYHFRHSRMNYCGDILGFVPTELQHLKGASDIRSVNPYLHSRKLFIKAERKPVE